jgi:hypothetical protein
LILRALRGLSPPIDSILDIGVDIGILHHELIAAIFFRGGGEWSGS